MPAFWKYPRCRVLESVRIDHTIFLRSFLIQGTYGTGNPVFFRWRISLGTRAERAFLRIYLVVRPFNLYWTGREAANSSTWWSKKGTRSSRELAMVILSALISRSSGSHVLVSTYSIWSR